MMRDPETALEAHAREELGIDPALARFPVGRRGLVVPRVRLGALIPLLPWFFGSGDGAVLASVVLAASPRPSSAACSPGSPVDRSCSRRARQVAIAAVAASVTFGVGVLLGT